MKRQLQQMFAPVRLLALDFDGVLTDGSVLVDSAGMEAVRCSHRDGQGIQALRAIEIPIVVISGQRSGYVQRRCEKMTIPCFGGITDKVGCLIGLLRKRWQGVTLQQVCFVGDDTGDIPILRAVGVPCSVSNGIQECKKISRYITQHRGGDGAIREICDVILDARGGDR